MLRTKDPVLESGRRIRLGLWGLGRGMSFYDTCKSLNIDVAAGCDFNEPLRARFREACPRAFVTADAAEFLRGDFDAVLLATYCTEHADDTIACLRAGKHVLSEVTAFHTAAEGVRLVEAVENAGLVYNLAENYPFTPAQMFIAEKWHEGLFGDLMYAEGEYVHEIRSLCYTYGDGTPIEPGDALHPWRSWLPFHYYCTHSLGPVMVATGTRPTRVVSLPAAHTLAGFPLPKLGGLGAVAPSLVSMSNGAVFRNLMGGTTNDTHVFRYWGTRGSAEISDQLYLRLGGGGGSPKLAVRPTSTRLNALARRTGHGGGDFWVLYYFVRQILTGEPAPFDVYAAADCTLPGILAYRSSLENGTPYDVPDFRKPAVRRKYRNDHFAVQRPDVTRVCFPRRADKALTRQFNGTISRLIGHAPRYRAFTDWTVVSDAIEDPARLVEMADALLEAYPDMVRVIKEARQLADAYPRSEGARLLREMLDAAGEQEITQPGFLARVRRARRRFGRPAKR